MTDTHTKLLSEAEFDVLILTAQGLTAEDIALVRGTSSHTVRHQRYTINIKLNARSIAHAVSIAYRTGILTVRRVGQ